MFAAGIRRFATIRALLITGSLLASSLVTAGALRAQDTTTAKRDSAVKIKAVNITAEREIKPVIAGSAVTTQILPVAASVTAEKVGETVNIVDTEDAVKYLPSVFLRKRNNGDTQAVLGTRVWGVSGSARSLIFADGVPLTALIGNNNTSGSPRWGLVAPNEIVRIDMMYGPYSAAYSGNSMGAVMEITTRLPQKLEASLNQTQSVQTFDLYGTSSNFGMAQTFGSVGNRFGDFAFSASANYQDSRSQPIGYVTSATFPSGTSGGYTAQNKLGAAANILGASGLLHTQMTNAKVKMAYDITPTFRAAYTFGYWNNNSNSADASYITTTSSGQSTFAGQSGFATGYNTLGSRHSSHSLSLRTENQGDWDFEAVGTLYRFDKDQQRSPTTASASGTSFGTAGRVAVLDGTGWNTVDLKAVWHDGGRDVAAHTLSFGVHDDHYTLFNPTYNVPDWTTGDNYSGVATEGDGKTSTDAFWVQDAWRITPAVKLTVGGRYEQWRAYDGYNVNGTTKITQPKVDLTRFSPKAMVAWTASPEWQFSASVGQAYRFPTAAELYQLISTGTTFTSPDPNLKPDNVLAMELGGQRKFEGANIGFTLFRQDVHDAIISQFLPLVAGSSTLFSAVSNVDHVVANGAELVFGVDDNIFYVPGLGLSGSVTYLDARIVAMSGRASATAAPGAAIGKKLPNIPDWRMTLLATYHANDRLTLSGAGRYSGQLYTTLDNADVNTNTYQGFDSWFVVDARANYRFDRRWEAGLGVDNVLNRKYFFFHPFPQRTFVANVKFAL